MHCLPVIYFLLEYLKQTKFYMVQFLMFLSFQDVEVRYFQAYIDGVDFVFIESHMFQHMEHNIYGGTRVV